MSFFSGKFSSLLGAKVPTSKTSNNIVLKFVIVGASVAGLSCAYLLRECGHSVTVVEQRSNLVEKSGNGTLRIPPNMARLMKLFPGATELLKEKGSLCSAMAFSSGETCKLLGQMVFLEEITSDLGSEMFLVPYNDLITYLQSICEKSGVKLKLNFTVKEVITQDNIPTVVAKGLSGKRYQADIVIGADGKNSIVRRVVANRASESEDEDDFIIDTPGAQIQTSEDPGRATLSFTIPISEVEKDPELLPLVQDDRWMVWCATGIWLGTARYGKDQFGVSITRFPTQRDTDSDWHKPVATSSIEQQFDQFNMFHPKLQKLIRMSKNCNANIQHHVLGESIVDPTSTVVLIGDASHTIPINGPYNTSCALEHAFALSRLFSRIKSRSQIPVFLNGYNEIRRGRTEQLVAMETDAQHLVTLPPGPDRDGRDLFFGRTLHADGPDDETIAQLWTSYVEAFDFDAIDAVDEWWLTWGRSISEGMS